MPKLILSMDGLVLKEIQITKQRTTIGRKPHNDIQIDNMAISGEHAAIVAILDDAFLEDLNSTNGTLVNGQAIKKHILRNNDAIDLGKYRLKYLVDEAGPAGASLNYQRGGESRAEFDGTRSAVEPPLPPPQPAPPMALPLVTVRLLTGPQAGKELELIKALTTLGKPGEQVAVITRQPNGVFVTHSEGDEYPTVNGRPIGAEPWRLKTRDVVEIARVRMEIRIRA